MLKIGLTGGIGSGKTTVANLFSKRNIAVIDADEINHELACPGKAGYQAMIDLFGTEILAADKTVDRGRLRDIVFSSPDQRQRLESALHPLIYAEINARIAAADSAYCIVCVPLLLETGHQSMVDRILVVDCSTDTQIRRVQRRDQNSEQQTRRIIGSQVPREQRLQAADDVLTNEADHSSLDLQVEKLHNFYLRLSATAGPAN